MKILRYILIIIIPALILLGCKETTYPDCDAEKLPVKPTGISIPDINKVRTLPDGSLLVPIKTEDSLIVVAKINSDGVASFSDTIKNVFSDDLVVSPSGECLVFEKRTKGIVGIAKLDASGKLVLAEDIETNDNRAIITLLSDGNIAYFNGYNPYNIDDVDPPFKMSIVGNNFKYTVNSSASYDVVAAFDDILVAYGKETTHDYLIFRPDGIATGSGTFDGAITNVRYIGGYLYFLLYVSDFNLDDGSIIEDYYIAKMDISGNQLFCEKIDAKEVNSNFTVHDGKLITTGTVITDEEQDIRTGAVLVIDDQSGKLSATIPVEYLGCSVMPIYVTPYDDGGYCVYAVRREHYDAPANGKGSSTKEGGMLYIYRAEQLIELNINK